MLVALIVIITVFLDAVVLWIFIGRWFWIDYLVAGQSDNLAPFSGTAAQSMREFGQYIRAKREDRQITPDDFPNLGLAANESVRRIWYGICGVGIAFCVSAFGGFLIFASS